MSELAAPPAVSLPTVMQRLDVLERSGLVRSEKLGRVRTCRLEPGPMDRDTHRALSAYLDRVLTRFSVAYVVAQARPYRELFPLPWPEHAS